MLSPRRMMVLCFPFDSPWTISSAFFRTRFIWGTSYPSSVPLYERPDRSSTITRLFKDPCKIFKGFSMILHCGARICLVFIRVLGLMFAHMVMGEILKNGIGVIGLLVVLW